MPISLWHIKSFVIAVLSGMIVETIPKLESDRPKQGVPVFMFKHQCKRCNARRFMIQMRLIHSHCKAVTMSSPSLQFMSNRRIQRRCCIVPFLNRDNYNDSLLCSFGYDYVCTGILTVTLAFASTAHPLLHSAEEDIIAITGGAALTTLAAAAVVTAVAATTTAVDLFFDCPHPLYWLIVSKSNWISKQPTQTD